LVVRITKKKDSEAWRVVMHKQQFKRWQVIAGSLLFVAVMGLVGSIDQDSKQAHIDEKTHVRDQVKQAVDRDENIWTAYYVERSRAGK
jgi:hypothetical protein